MKNKDKSKKPVVYVDKNSKKIQRYLVALPIIAFLIKVIIIFNTQYGGWYGADGENYMAGVDGLLRDGFFSDEGKLSYWPAGYPLLIWPLAEITLTNVYYLLSLIQSLFFAYSTYFFTKQLTRTKFAHLAFLTSVIVSFNPTLSLSSLSVGYETPIAACFMMALGTIIKSYKTEDSIFSIKATFFASVWFALAIFMQPRFILVGLLLIVIWALKFSSRRSAATLLIVSIVVMASTPAIMIYRNIKVIDQAIISTNLGVTMSIGAGDQTSGGYLRTGPEVPCKPISPEISVTDNRRVQCVLEWYVQNPLKSVKLAFNKSQFFWSPWSGPLAEGTMARNPWLKVAPTQGIAKNMEGNKLVYGNVGKFISYSWITAQIFLLFIGYRQMRRYGALEKFYANLFLLPIVLSWALSIGTIGDHRFRIPTMALSLLLQAAGLVAIKNKLFKVS
jgi:hypothetical protein